MQSFHTIDVSEMCKDVFLSQGIIHLALCAMTQKTHSHRHFQCHIFSAQFFYVSILLDQALLQNICIIFFLIMVNRDFMSNFHQISDIRSDMPSAYTHKWWNIWLCFLFISKHQQIIYTVIFSFFY